MPSTLTEDKALVAGFVATQVGEALANYPQADAPLAQHSAIVRLPPSNAQAALLEKEQAFWAARFAEKANGSTGPSRVSFFGAAVSEWVARVPGLFWRPGSDKMRALKPADRESEKQTKGWITFRPRGKSQLVSGGIGTLKFPPSEDGFRVVTLTTSHNASTGVLALVSPEVWDHHRLTEGTIIYGEARWAPIPLGWAPQFPIVAGVPRGCLILDKVGEINVMEQNAPIQVHPYSVMEYWDGSARLHDFVYITVDTGDPDLRRKTTEFFADYRGRNDRDGRYLLSADIADPLWEATFTSPAEIRLNRQAEMAVIEARVNEAVRGEGVIEALIRALAQLSDIADLKRVSGDAEIPVARWFEVGPVAVNAARLVAEAVRTGRQQALLQVAMAELQ